MRPSAGFRNCLAVGPAKEQGPLSGHIVRDARCAEGARIHDLHGANRRMAYHFSEWARNSTATFDSHTVVALLYNLNIWDDQKSTSSRTKRREQ